MTPRTDAGKRLLDKHYWQDAPRPLKEATILAIEAEARRDALTELRAEVEQRDHDYTLHLDELSPAASWTDEAMTVYAATVGGFLALVDAALAEGSET